VCLPGLARTTADFDALAPALAYDKPQRRVIAIDSRGRGESEHDANPKNYNLSIELGDLVAVLIALEIKRAVFIGSSRGGILTMLLAAAHPEMIAGAVLHDIGPVIEPEGVARIKSYVGKLRQPQTFEEGDDILRGLFAVQFPNFTSEQWYSAAQRTWKPQTGKLVLTYDLWPRVWLNSTSSIRCRHCGTNSRRSRRCRSCSFGAPDPISFPRRP